jgi:hypothetical protein
MMMTDEILADLADCLAAGEMAYLHKTTYELLAHPDSRRWNDAETDYEMDRVLERVIQEPHNFVRIDPPEPHDSYRMMEEFAFTREDAQLIKRLADALQGKKPFRLFRQAAEDAGVLDDWYDFEFEQLKEWAKQELIRKWDA